VQSFLYQTDGRRPTFYAAVVVVLVSTAALAALAPARRASRTDPAVVLRAQ
jgi:ABC-type lipoprotein release transport system permease subunit